MYYLTHMHSYTFVIGGVFAKVLEHIKIVFCSITFKLWVKFLFFEDRT
nr:MAG TPA: hypothetical protein [Bacteriophage sp.]